VGARGRVSLPGDAPRAIVVWSAAKACVADERIDDACVVDVRRAGVSAVAACRSAVSFVEMVMIEGSGRCVAVRRVDRSFGRTHERRRKRSGSSREARPRWLHLDFTNRPLREDAAARA
jgi:hypothetical protein